MSALTHTLLPEPVAPATSRWGILARSTAYALPDTSRPRAKVSGLVESSIWLSSTRGLKPTTSLTELGISMPTTSLPGMGASMRMERAARAMARSSARASMRETLTWCSGRTSYWVTTGPGVDGHDLGRDGEAQELLLDPALVRFVIDRRRPGGRVRAAPGARSRAGSSRWPAATRGRSAPRRSRQPRRASRCRHAARWWPGCSASVARRRGLPVLPPSPGPVQTVWLSGDWPTRGAGSSRMLRAAWVSLASTPGPTGTTAGVVALAAGLVRGGRAVAALGRRGHAHRGLATEGLGGRAAR